MAEKILIMGESGTGKSTSIRNCDPSITAIVNPVGKPLPFRGAKNYETLNGETDAEKICDFMRNQAKNGKKIIIIDDFQYILAIPYMNRIKETGWDKYNDFGANYFTIINVCSDLPDDVCVYYLTHCETLENGLTTVKLIGKLLREKITVEGLFTIVLKTGTSEGKYYFFTQNSGKDTVKSPIGMFDAFSIDNDLAYVDAKIRNYYEMDGAKSDAEIAKLDETMAGDVEKPEPRRRRGGHIFESEKEDASKSSSSISDESSASSDSGSDDSPKRRRKTHDEVVEENNKKIAEYVQAEADAVVAAGEGDEVPLDKVEKVDAPALESVPRRRRIKATEDFVPVPENMEIPFDNSHMVKDTPVRRTRKERS